LFWYLALRVEFSSGRAVPASASTREMERRLAPRWRATFERALASHASKATPLLWRCYVGAEIAVGQLAAARRVFLRAVDACPWDKAIWLDGIRDLSSVFTAKERSGLLDTMRAKGIHARTDMYEVKLELLSSA
jgi:hypothetical protein